MTQRSGGFIMLKVSDVAAAKLAAYLQAEKIDQAVRIALQGGG